MGYPKQRYFFYFGLIRLQAANCTNIQDKTLFQSKMELIFHQFFCCGSHLKGFDKKLHVRYLERVQYMLSCLFLGGIVSRGITEISGESAVHVVLFISRWYSIPGYH